ncbi:unnamed protein product [Amoebophrya sp. A25]|nr:unnamed protein product [Amoebophrya sp. A25]|eukprot:GSA25T00013844001.1
MYFSWPRLQDTVDEVLATCVDCQMLHRKEAELRNYGFAPPRREIFRSYVIDHITDLPDAGGFTCILRVVEELIDYIWLIPVASTSHEETWNALETRVWAEVGWPLRVKGDGFFREMKLRFARRGVHLAIGLKGNARGQWQAERPNRDDTPSILKTCWRAKSSWPRLCGMLQLLSRNTPRPRLGNKSPAEYATGQKLLFPNGQLADALNQPETNVSAAAAADILAELDDMRKGLAARHEDQHRDATQQALARRGALSHTDIAVGDLVVERSAHKSKRALEYGPDREAVFQVTDVIQGGMLKIVDTRKMKHLIDGEMVTVNDDTDQQGLLGDAADDIPEKTVAARFYIKCHTPRTLVIFDQPKLLMDGAHECWGVNLLTGKFIVREAVDAAIDNSKKRAKVKRKYVYRETLLPQEAYKPPFFSVLDF